MPGAAASGSCWYAEAARYLGVACRSRARVLAGGSRAEPVWWVLAVKPSSRDARFRFLVLSSKEPKLPFDTIFRSFDEFLGSLCKFNGHFFAIRLIAQRFSERVAEK